MKSDRWGVPESTPPQDPKGGKQTDGVPTIRIYLNTSPRRRNGSVRNPYRWPKIRPRLRNMPERGFYDSISQLSHPGRKTPYHVEGPLLTPSVKDSSGNGKSEHP